MTELVTRYIFRIWTLITVAVLSVSVDAMEPKAASWTQWRGPHRDGQLPADSLPENLSEESLKEAWHIPLGPSYSGPLVIGDRVFITETKDKKFEVVRALDRATGKQIWETEWEGAMTVPFFARSNGDWIRATPAYDDGRLFVAGMRDLLVCLDAKTGKQQWQVDFVKDTGSSLPSFGFVASPLVHGDHVYVQAGGSVAKLEKTTGKIVWQVLKDGGGMSGSAFSSPTLATIDGKQQLVVQTRTTLAGVDLEGGEVLWSQEIPAFRGMNIVTPTIVDDTVFTSSYGGTSLLFSVKQGDDAFEVNQLWNNRSQGYMSSPIVIDGHVYLHLRNQRFMCIELASGETKWKTKPFGKYWSLVFSGDRILALDEQGELLLIAADPSEFKLLDSRKVSEESTWAHLGVSGNEIFVRELNGLRVFRWDAAASGD